MDSRGDLVHWFFAGALFPTGTGLLGEMTVADVGFFHSPLPPKKDTGIVFLLLSYSFLFLVFVDFRNFRGSIYG